MNIVINTDNVALVNEFIRVCKDKGDTVVIAKPEDVLFKNIEAGGIDAYILSETPYASKAIDFIKKSNPYIPVILIVTPRIPVVATKADMLMEIGSEFMEEFLCRAMRHNIASYIRNFALLKKLTAKTVDVIEFGGCRYDPTRLMLYVKDKEIKKFSKKEGGLLEILAANFGNVVNRVTIMERVWGKSDYFVGRSLDVYTTHVRKSLKTAGINMVVKNISNSGLILEFEPK